MACAGIQHPLHGKAARVNGPCGPRPSPCRPSVCLHQLCLSSNSTARSVRVASLMAMLPGSTDPAGPRLSPCRPSVWASLSAPQHGSLCLRCFTHSHTAQHHKRSPLRRDYLPSLCVKCLRARNAWFTPGASRDTSESCVTCCVTGLRHVLRHGLRHVLCYVVRQGLRQGAASLAASQVASVGSFRKPPATVETQA